MDLEETAKRMKKFTSHQKIIEEDVESKEQQSYRRNSGDESP